MDYGKAYLFLTRKPQTGYKNLLMATLMNFVPVVGPIILLGYIVVVAEWLLNDEKRENYPDFSFDRFMDYLKLGVWPFVMALIVMMAIFMPLYMITMGAAFGIGYATSTPILMPILMVIGGLFVGTLFSILIGPMVFYSQKVQKFDIKGSFQFTKQFLKTVGGLYCITTVINMFASTLVSMVGLILCFIGIYPAQTITQFAYEHLFIQLYDEYIKRGGEALPAVELPRELAYVGAPEPKLTPEQADYDDPEFR